jgi:hypothetical protein
MRQWLAAEIPGRHDGAGMAIEQPADDGGR